MPVYLFITNKSLYYKNLVYFHSAKERIQIVFAYEKENMVFRYLSLYLK